MTTVWNRNEEPTGLRRQEKKKKSFHTLASLESLASEVFPILQIWKILVYLESAHFHKPVFLFVLFQCSFIYMQVVYIKKENVSSVIDLKVRKILKNVDFDDELPVNSKINRKKEVGKKIKRRFETRTTKHLRSTPPSRNPSEPTHKYTPTLQHTWYGRYVKKNYEQFISPPSICRTLRPWTDDLEFFQLQRRKLYPTQFSLPILFFLSSG